LLGGDFCVGNRTIIGASFAREIEVAECGLRGRFGESDNHFSFARENAENHFLQRRRV
jgi:hypothetical protein